MGSMWGQLLGEKKASVSSEFGWLRMESLTFPELLIENRSVE